MAKCIVSFRFVFMPALDHRKLFYQLLSAICSDKLCKAGERLEQLGRLVSLICLPSLSDKQSSHMMILQRRYDLSGLEWLSSGDCGQGDEE